MAIGSHFQDTNPSREAALGNTGGRLGSVVSPASESPSLGYSFDALGLAAVAAVNDVPNVASEKMLLKAGFRSLSEVEGPKYRLRTYILERKAWQQRDRTPPRGTPSGHR